MTIASKSGGLILKDNKLATNCGCCQPSQYCIRILSSGWSGWFNQDFSTLLGTVDPINGDGYGNGLSVSPQLTRPYTVVWFTFSSTARFSLTIGTATITATLHPHYASFPQDRIVMESNEVDAFLNGSIVTISNVVSQTLDPTRWGVDRYGQSAFETIGVFQVRRTALSLCNCSCSVNVFQNNSPIVYPETYTLNFTNTAYIPAGPRSDGTTIPSLPFGRSSQKYASFLPSWPCPDPYLQRLGQPIVMRKVQGSTQWKSDPIHKEPCATVVYQFDYCLGLSPRLMVLAVSDAGQVSQFGTTVYADAALCSWNAEQHTNNPSSYQDTVSQQTYLFANFATVTPGGQYQPEQYIACNPGGTISLAEGCFGLDCPPTEIAVTLTGSGVPNGTYILPRLSAGCSQSMTNRSVYGGTFTFDAQHLVITIKHGGNVGGFQFVGTDDCPCGTRRVWWRIDGSYGSVNADRLFASNNSCYPICMEEGTVLTASNQFLQASSGFGSFFPGPFGISVEF